MPELMGVMCSGPSAGGCKMVICWNVNKSMVILNIIVSWYLARLVSKDSHSRCSSMDVTLLVFLYRFVTYLAARLCTISSLLM